MALMAFKSAPTTLDLWPQVESFHVIPSWPTAEANCRRVGAEVSGRTSDRLDLGRAAGDLLPRLPQLSRPGMEGT